MLSDEELWLREEYVKRLVRAQKLLSDNQKAALIALENVANEGSVLAMLFLATEYRYVLKDYAAAEKWYRAAYERNSSRGLYFLGVLYFAQGKFREAEEIFLDGTSRGDAASMYGLARVFLLDQTNPGHLAKARELLEKSRAAGQLRSRFQLAFLLMGGKYGLWNIVRGLWLYFSGLPKTIWLAWRHPDSKPLW